jgi:hypothetical protein
MNLDKVMTGESTMNDHDGSICATKVFDSANLDTHFI